tara:strand:- start:1342 stop:1740 length:399 start_codon:yes stop_codon:yes gene_type:complete
MKYDNVISLAATVCSNKKDLSDLTRDGLIRAFTNRINDIFDNHELEEAVSLEDQIQNTTYTIWYKNTDHLRECLTEEEMRIQAEVIFRFDADEVVKNGEIFFWNKGVEPYDNPRSDSDDILGGCFKVEGGAV